MCSDLYSGISYIEENGSKVFINECEEANIRENIKLFNGLAIYVLTIVMGDDNAAKNEYMKKLLDPGSNAQIDSLKHPTIINKTSNSLIFHDSSDNIQLCSSYIISSIMHSSIDYSQEMINKLLDSYNRININVFSTGSDNDSEFYGKLARDFGECCQINFFYKD